MALNNVVVESKWVVSHIPFFKQHSIIKYDYIGVSDRLSQYSLLGKPFGKDGTDNYPESIFASCLTTVDDLLQLLVQLNVALIF